MARRTGFVALAAVAASAQDCRDQNLWPFAAESVWNTPLGSGAEWAPANLYPTAADAPQSFFSDDDYFITTTADDPSTAWYSQGWWGPPYDEAHCNITGPYHGNITFPYNRTVTAFGNNNAAAILQPDNRSLVLTQPLYRCTPGSPILSLYDSDHGTADIRGNGTWGGHGGSSLSALGGAIRLGELLPGAAPMRHALKLELYAKQYYYNHTPCFHWPALNCDGYYNDPSSPLAYGGTDPLLTPGALLAVPPAAVPALNASLQTEPARRILFSLANYGGYIVDDTAWYRGTFCTEHGVTDEFYAAYGFSFNVDNSTTVPQETQWYADLLALFRSLQIVSNNGPNSIGGGGDPVQPLAPPFCNYTSTV
jgi:hypothetical protein